MPLSLPRRKPANRQAPLKRHLPRPRERHPVHGAVVGHITDLETIVCRRVNGPTRVQTKRRHRSTVSVADRADPGSDAQRSPGQCNVGCNLHSDSAAFTWTGHYLSRPVDDCDGYAALAAIRNIGLDDPSPVVQIHLAISVARLAAPRSFQELTPGCSGVRAVLVLVRSGPAVRSSRREPTLLGM